MTAEILDGRAMGAEIKAHDPYVQHWWELESQDSYPAVGASWSRFFRNQEHLSEFRMTQDLREALKGSDAMVLAVRHKPYLDLNPDDVVEMAGGPLAVIDCFGILDDEKIERYFELGCEVKGLGRGHISRIKEKVRRKRLGGQDSQDHRDLLSGLFLKEDRVAVYFLRSDT